MKPVLHSFEKSVISSFFKDFESEKYLTARATSSTYKHEFTNWVIKDNPKRIAQVAEKDKTRQQIP